MTRNFRLKVATEKYVHSIYIGHDFQHIDKNSALRPILKNSAGAKFSALHVRILRYREVGAHPPPTLNKPAVRGKLTTRLVQK